MGLTAATYLGDNTVPILDALTHQLRDAGVAIRVDPGAGRTSADARAHAAATDLVWMCGSLAIVLAGDGALAHDVVAAPVFSGQPSAVYHSVFVAREGGPTSVAAALSGRIALNEPESWSGHHGLRRHLNPDWFASATWTGAHRASAQAVAAGECDVAGVDMTVWAHLAATEPDLTAGLRVIGRTADWSAPPFLVHPRVGAERATILATLLASTPPGLDAIVATTAATYQPLHPGRA